MNESQRRSFATIKRKNCLRITSKKMGDHPNEELQLQNRRADEESEEEEEYEEELEEEYEEEYEEENGSNERDDRTRLLIGQDLHLDDETVPWILDNIDFFVSQSQGNESVEHVRLYPYLVYGHDDDVWDKLGQAIGNLKALKRLCIASFYNGDDDEDPPIVDWDIVASILRHVRQRITMDTTEVIAWAAEESGLFVRAIHGHPTITSFEVSGYFPYESLDALYSALATLPALESVKLSAAPEDESAPAHPESLTELLRVPSLQSVGFEFFDFTHALCQATANALLVGTVITRLEFKRCAFCNRDGAAILANALTRNTSVSYIEVESPLFWRLNGALAAALPSNSTWRDLVLSGRRIDNDADFSPIILALGKNTALKTLTIGAFGSMDESLCTAMQDGLGMNETLESLELTDCLCGESADMWCRALSFLRTNKALKSLRVTFHMDATESCVSTLRSHIADVLQENASLESLSIRRSGCRNGLKVEEYLCVVTALQHNTTLKSLDLGNSGSLDSLGTMTHNEEMQMAALLKKNYALERLPGINLKNRGNDVGAILRLNEAGRRYLVQDGSSISKGVKLLGRVNNDVNCALLHLMENPRLCDRSAVEKVSAGESNGRSTNESSG
jgi:hypothetical protein